VQLEWLKLRLNPEILSYLAIAEHGAVGVAQTHPSLRTASINAFGKITRHQHTRGRAKPFCLLAHHWFPALRVSQQTVSNLVASGAVARLQVLFRFAAAAVSKKKKAPKARRKGPVVLTELIEEKHRGTARHCEAVGSTAGLALPEDSEVADYAKKI